MILLVAVSVCFGYYYLDVSTSRFYRVHACMFTVRYPTRELLGSRRFFKVAAESACTRIFTIRYPTHRI